MRRGGKRLRPRLCKAVFAACGGEGDISCVCDAVECFHKASLVHDDIQDGDEERYGRPTVWKEHGVAVAIAAGDWLVAHGYELILKSGLSASPRMFAATVASHVRLCEGQGDDLLVPSANPLVAPRLDEAAYLSVCERKTGEGFALAAQLGALAADAPDAEWREFGLEYGVLFQIADDLSDGAARPELEALRRERLLRLMASPAMARGRGHFEREGVMP
jgi:geranylgeranyl pyrophosphate synthase